MDDLSGTLEENILTALCWLKEEAPIVLLHVPSALYSTPHYRRIAQIAADFYERHRAPAGPHLRDHLEDELGRASTGDLYDIALRSMERLAPMLVPAHVQGQIAGFVKRRTLAPLLDKARDVLDQDGPEASLELLQDGLAALPTPALDDGTWLADPDQALAFLSPRDDDYFSIGIPALDRLGVSPARKTLTILIAPPKRGKSWFLVNVGKRAIMHRRKVLHISLEMREQQVARRYIQALFALTKSESASVKIPQFRRAEDGSLATIDASSVSADGLTEEARTRIATRLRAMSSRINVMIKEFPTGSVSVSDIARYMDALEHTRKFVPDILIVDYPDLMRLQGRDLRIDMGRAFRDLRGLAGQRDIAVVAVTQSNRESSAAKVVGTTMVAEDFSKIQTADTVLTYSQTQEERQIGLARILVAAARDVEDRKMCLISQAYQMGQFCLDSVLMSGPVREELSRTLGAQDSED